MVRDTKQDFAIRAARPDDVPTILRFVKALAEFERLADKVTATEATLANSLFGARAHAECLVAECGRPAFAKASAGDEASPPKLRSSVGGAPAGIALFFHNFSTFTGKPGLYLEDIFVAPEFRSLGIGLAFFRELARIALVRDCTRLEWSVLDWNARAIKFYRRLGAEPMSEWTVQRLTREKIEKLAAT